MQSGNQPDQHNRHDYTHLTGLLIDQIQMPFFSEDGGSLHTINDPIESEMEAVLGSQRPYHLSTSQVGNHASFS